MYSSAGHLRKNYSGSVWVLNKKGEWIEKPLIEGSTKEQWKFIEGSAFNLTLDEVRVVDRYSEDEVMAYIGPDERWTPKTIALEPHAFEARGKQRFGWVLAAESEVLLVSSEITNIPLDRFMPIKSRFTFASAFASMTCSDLHPNYQNRVTTLLKVGKIPLALGKGCDFIFVRLAHLTDDRSDGYQGVWQQDECTSGTNGIAVRPK